MKRFILYTIFTIILILKLSCSNTISFTPNYNNDNIEEFKPYINSFNDNIKKTKKFIIGFKSLKNVSKTKNVVGLCSLNLFPFSGVITIDPNYWKRSHFIDKLSLIYHEGGHCYCYLPHNSVIMSDGCPKSLMYPSVISRGCLHKHWFKYVDNLKKDCS